MAIPFNQLTPIQFDPAYALFEEAAQRLMKADPNQPFRPLQDLLNATVEASEVAELSEVAQLRKVCRTPAAMSRCETVTT